jgi:two-component system chemotaxis response regulator CheY
MRALIVDDSRAIRVIVGRTIRDLGFDADEAGNGQEALVRLEAAGTPIALALVDWNMPVMNGFELVKAVRADSRHAGMRIVMITTENDLAHMQSALEAGADEYIMKPFTKEILREKLELLGFESPVAAVMTDGAGG